jgi:hypothetical protein
MRYFANCRSNSFDFGLPPEDPSRYRLDFSWTFVQISRLVLVAVVIPEFRDPPLNTPSLPWWAGTLRNASGILGLAAALAILTSFFYFRHFHDFYTNDSRSYIDPAANLLGGHGFTDERGYPDTHRTPGYPLMILPFSLGRS